MFFVEAVHKSTVAGMFLAVLELVRHHHARATQSALFGEIWLEPGAKPLPEQVGLVLEYEHATSEQVEGQEPKKVKGRESRVKGRKRK